MAKRSLGQHSVETPNAETDKAEHKPNPAVNKETRPNQTHDRQADNSAAAAVARQSFPTPKDMTYQTPNGAMVGKEHTLANGTPLLQTENGQLYKGKLNDNGNITQWQPIDDKGKETGKPINVTSERTGAHGVSEQNAAPKADKVPEPSKSRIEIRSKARAEIRDSEN